jgi:hypothetical protein
VWVCREQGAEQQGEGIAANKTPQLANLQWRERVAGQCDFHSSAMRETAGGVMIGKCAADEFSDNDRHERLTGPMAQETWEAP